MNVPDIKIGDALTVVTVASNPEYGTGEYTGQLAQVDEAGLWLSQQRTERYAVSIDSECQQRRFVFVPWSGVAALCGSWQAIEGANSGE